MKQENKTLLIKYIVSFCIASLITVLVFWIKGFFVHSTAVNVQILADGFTVSGLMMSLFAGMVYVSDEGALLGIGYVSLYHGLFLLDTVFLELLMFALYFEFTF